MFVIINKLGPGSALAEHVDESQYELLRIVPCGEAFKFVIEGDLPPLCELIEALGSDGVDVLEVRRYRLDDSLDGSDPDIGCPPCGSRFRVEYRIAEHEGLYCKPKEFDSAEAALLYIEQAMGGSECNAMCEGNTIVMSITHLYQEVK